MSTVDYSLLARKDITVTAENLRVLKRTLNSRTRYEIKKIEVVDILIATNDTLTVLSDSVEFGTTEVDRQLVESINIIKFVNRVVSDQVWHGAWMDDPVAKS